MDDKSAPLDNVLRADYDDAMDYVLSDLAPNGYEVTFKYLSEAERAYLISTFETNRSRWRRIHQTALREQQRRERKITKLRALLLQDVMWAAEGGDIAIKDMTPNHAKNAYNLMVSEWRRYAGVVRFEDLKIGYVTPEETPLAVALLKRSQKRSTRRDKRKDDASREAYKNRQAKAMALAHRIWSFDEW